MTVSGSTAESTTSPLAGKPAPRDTLVDVPKLLTAYEEQPDPQDPAQLVSFGTSGHRGSSLHGAFNEAHILAITQAICEHRASAGISGPLFVGIDTHALSLPALRSAVEVLAAHEVDVRLTADDSPTPTPVVSHAILRHNGSATGGTSAGAATADGIVITPSHNPPEDGGFKYDPPSGGPADAATTKAIQDRANELLRDGLRGVQRIPYERARGMTTAHDFVSPYVDDLSNVLDLEAVARSGVRIGVDPLGGASVNYWPAIADRYGLDLTVTNPAIDPTFRFMTVDWDGRIRMDPSSRFAMASLLGLRDRFDVAVACDTDADRHGIVTPSAGLLNPNHYLAVMVEHLFGQRPDWPADAGVGKTVVSSSIIDAVAAGLGRRLLEVPVGFKWFVDGLFDGSIGFGGEESAGASFLRRDGHVWTTDKDGLIAALLAAEITARAGADPGELYDRMTARYGAPAYRRIDAPADAKARAALGALTENDMTLTSLAGDDVVRVMSRAPGNDQAIGGIKVVTSAAWFAARPSGTEAVYKLYAESSRGEEHLSQVLAEAQQVVDRVITA
jgi:phosphoglucomutase